MLKLQINVPAYAVVYGKKNLKKILRQVGALVARKARSLIRSSKQSAPGQPPASRTGALAASIKVRPSRSGESVSVRDTQFYALFLEKGAVGGGGRKGNSNRRAAAKGKAQSSIRNLEARPFLSTALAQTEDLIRSKITTSVAQDMGLTRK